ncbi:hypothetical protein [Egicoccus halophilus]|uniref:Transmembrane protein n=1 Tax=Egicoccus halophilus TaxID=1670830 RepID=A0A8J3ETD5_9ACTN|nr:hypothetical protein [Egicoccus halophilus]GGI09345.1 hypothetical protein GCM10011354_33610 [Egicoccus halophilus]
MGNGNAPVTWFGVAVAGLTASAGLALALVVVLRTRDADVLAVVALVLAVVSLLSQLMIALAQFFAASQQQAANADLNQQTQTALAEIRSLTADLSQRLAYQIERLTEVSSDRDSRAHPPVLRDPFHVGSADANVRAHRHDDSDGVELSAGSLAAWLESSGCSEVQIAESPVPHVRWVSLDGISCIATVLSAVTIRSDKLRQHQRLARQVEGPSGAHCRFIVCPSPAPADFAPESDVTWVDWNNRRADLLESPA